MERDLFVLEEEHLLESHGEGFAGRDDDRTGHRGFVQRRNNDTICCVKEESETAFDFIEIESKLLLACQRVDHVGYGADPVDSVNKVERLGDTRESYGDDIAFSYTQLDKSGCSCFDILKQLGEGDLSAKVVDSYLLNSGIGVLIILSV